MTMKQSPSRNQRSKGFKVKHVLQILVLLAICVWVLFQVKRSHDKRKSFDEEISSKVIGKLQSGGDVIRLGRRDLQPLVKDDSTIVEKNIEKDDDEEEEEEEEVDAREWEESEVTEDLIDEEDRESEEDKGIDFEDPSEIEEAKTNLREAMDDAVRDRLGISRSLRKVQVENAETLLLLPVNETTLNLASNRSDSDLISAMEERSEDPKAKSAIRSSVSDGSLSTVSQRTSELDEISENNTVSSGESTSKEESSKDENSTSSSDLPLYRQKSDMKKL